MAEIGFATAPEFTPAGFTLEYYRSYNKTVQYRDGDTSVYLPYGVFPQGEHLPDKVEIVVNVPKTAKWTKT